MIFLFMSSKYLIGCPSDCILNSACKVLIYNQLIEEEKVSVFWFVPMPCICILFHCYVWGGEGAAK